MSADYMFLGGRGHLPAAAARIATKHGAVLDNYRDPGGNKCCYFSCRNRGEPFNRDVERAVRADLVAAGILTDEGGRPR